MDKITKQSYLIHSMLMEFRKEIIGQIAQSITKNFNVPIDESLDKCNVLITGLFIHILYNKIISKMENGDEVALKFLERIGKSENSMKFIHRTFGNLESETNEKFRKDLEKYLGVPYENLLSEFYYMRIFTASESLVDFIIKESDNIELKDGVFDYNGITKIKKFIDIIQNELNKF